MAKIKGKKKPSGGGGGGSAPTPSTSWRSEHGSVALITAPNSIWAWKFPPKPRLVGYCTRAGVKLTGKAAIRWRFRIEGNAVFAPYHPESETKPCKVRLYFQRRGDTLSGAGKYEFYRWWGNAHVQILAPGSFDVTAPLDPAQWGSVLGKNGTQALSAWAAALADVGRMGFTMGGNKFAGHGVVVESGSANFVLEAYDVL